jgi:hypothetical protein
LSTLTQAWRESVCASNVCTFWEVCVCVCDLKALIHISYYWATLSLWLAAFHLTLSHKVRMSTI